MAIPRTQATTTRCSPTRGSQRRPSPIRQEVAMRKLLLGSLAALALIAGSAARAADMPAAPIVKAPPPAAIDWGGFYFGGHAGFAWSDVRFTFTDDVPNSEDLRFSPNSFIGGVQFGAQWQFDQWIMGV